MKAISFIFLFASVAYAGPALKIVPGAYIPGELGIVHPGHCYPAQQIQYEIVRKIDQTHFEMIGPQYISPHAILVVKTKNRIRDTGPLAMMITPIKSQMMGLENGFQKEFDIWQECPTPVTVWVDPNEQKCEALKESGDLSPGMSVAGCVKKLRKQKQ